MGVSNRKNSFNPKKKLTNNNNSLRHSFYTISSNKNEFNFEEK